MIKEYLTVGEMAGLFGLNVQTLHYYDRIGLMQPAVRKANGYRLYRFDQVYEMAQIRFMRRMGYSVEEIFETQQLKNSEEAVEKLREQSENIRRQSEELRRIDEALLRKAEYVETRMKELDPEKVCIRSKPEGYYLPIGGEEEAFVSEPFYLYPTLAVYEEDLRNFGALLTEEEAAEQRREKEDSVKVLPAGDYLVGWHVGPYETMQETFDRMRAQYPDLAYDSEMTAVTMNIVDQFVEKNPARYVTEVLMPLDPKAA